MRSWAIVVAAGSGSRFGGEKQFLPVGDSRVIDLSVASAKERCDGVVVVVSPSRVDAVAPTLDVEVVAGGATRSASVRAGLAAVPDHVDVVVVHDAARPLAPPELFEEVISAVADGADAAVPGIPLADTIKRVEGTAPRGNERVLVSETLDRDELVAVQTPQAFNAHALRRAHESGADASDDAGLIEDCGGKVVVVAGRQHNIKITVPADLDLARRLAQ